MRKKIYKFKIKKNVITVKLKQNFYLILKIITANIVRMYTLIMFVIIVKI